MVPASKRLLFVMDKINIGNSMKILYLGDKNLSSLGIFHILKGHFMEATAHFKCLAEFRSSLHIDEYDIVIFDCKNMDHEMDEVLRCLAQLNDVPVLVLAKNSDLLHRPHSELPMIRGVIDRDGGVESFLAAINMVMSGAYCYSWDIFSLQTTNEMQLNEEHYAKAGLTRREREILQLYLTGATNKAISIRLFRSEKTISAHKSNILRKLGLKKIPTPPISMLYK